MQAAQPQASTSSAPPLAAAPAEAPRVVGRRAKLSQEALEAAASKVIKTLTDSRMAQCFPTYKDEYPELMKALRTLVVNKFNEGIAWEHVLKQSDFIEKANELDRIVGEAEASRKKGEAPKALYKTGADPTITVASATVPILRAATAELKAKRLALEAKNRATYEQIAKDQQEAARREEAIKDILEQFQVAMRTLEEIDKGDTEDLQAKLVAVLPQEQLA
ncbi:mind kinetochore complex component Nnf1 [Pseudohyphozyma bogoriensis]|nr:mind kinetochore complex component Nnf1 [Pseudohyphozyma bogoriensis]